MAVIFGVVPSTLKLTMVSDAGMTEPAVGGFRQRKVRMGSHFRASGKFPPLTMDAGRAHTADIMRCELNVARLLIPQPELNLTGIGTPLVNTPGQFGFALNLDGFTPGYIIRKGQFFNHVRSDIRYLYSSTADVVVNGAGQANVPLWPLLRVPPNDDDVVDFATPCIEGWLSLDSGWEVTPDFTTETSFDIEEVG